MPPNQSTGSTTANSGGNNDSDKFHAADRKMQIENHLRVKRSEKLDRERRLHEVERNITMAESELHHLEQEHKRFTEALRRESLEVKKGSTIEKQEEMSLRESTQSLRKDEEAMRKLDHEIDALKQQIVEKEREKNEVKEETRGLMRVKEEHRRAGELEHFTIKSEGEHLHEHQVKLILLEQDTARHNASVEHMKQQQRELRHDINQREQDLMQTETELSRLNHG